MTTNGLPNCPISQAGILAAEHILGWDVGTIKGKTVRHPPHQVDTYTNPIPHEILDWYRKVTGARDVMMFVNGMPFLVTISWNIQFGTVEALSNTKGPTLIKVIKHMRDIYKQGGSEVDRILMDGQFEPLRAAIASLGLHSNDVTEDKHVGEAE